MAAGIPPAVLDPERLRAVASTGLAGSRPDADSDAAFDRLARLAAIVLEAPLAFLTIVDGEHSWYRAAVGLPADAPRCGAVEGSFCKYVIASHESLVVSDARLDERTRGNPSITQMNVVAWAGYPVIDQQGQVLGSFCVVDSVPRQWSEVQMETLRVLALAASDQLRLRAAIEAQRRASEEARELRLREHQLVGRFQRALLPRSLPASPGFVTAVRYVASSESSKMGGDWYDLMSLGGGSTGFAIGDVCGHDIDAVAIMSQLRQALHVLALTEPDPWAVVNLLDSSMHGDDLDRFASLIYAAWDVAAEELMTVVAGHPPPLLLRDQSAEFVEGGHRVLVGVGAEPAVGAPARTRLQADDYVVMFTDGLCERRGSTLGADLERLRKIVGGLERTGPERLCEEILTAMEPSEGWDDDVALLVLKRTD